METLDDEWQLSPENAHPNARRLLQPGFYWDIGDADSPFGNDTGYDTFEFYRAWIRHSDDVVIAVAFAQLVLEGNAGLDIAARASRALERQSRPEVIAFRGASDPAERSARCAEMLEVVQSAV